MNFADLMPWRRKSAFSTLDLFREIYGAKRSKSGETVGLKEALRCATAMACAKVIAKGIAQVPLKLFREDEATGKKAPAKDHPLYRLLHRKPNQWQTSFELRETLGLHLAFTGRAYCFKTIVRGVIKELIPFEPHKVRAKLADDGGLTYIVTGNDGQEREFAAGLIWHLKGPSWSGWEGLDAMDLAREAVGLAIATEAAHSEIHKNGMRPSGVYSVEGSLSPQQYKDLRKFLADNYAGDKQGLPMIVDRGAKWLSTALSGVDAQHLETRRFQVEEVCRAMDVAPIMVFQSDKATTYASAEAMFQAHVVHTLAPWWERIEQSIDCNLLNDADDRAGVYAKFLGQGLLRGSMKDRAEYFAKALGSGGSPAWMTPDEIRALEEMNPMGGDAAMLPKPTNVAPSPDPVAQGKADAMLLQLAEIKAGMKAQGDAPAPAPAINVASYAQPDMEPITALLKQSLEAMSDGITRSLAQAIKTGVAAVPAPIVNVCAAEQLAPVVNIVNEVAVQPATVDLTLSMPDRKTTTEVTYNGDGDIVRTVATESTAK